MSRPDKGTLQSMTISKNLCSNMRTEFANVYSHPALSGEDLRKLGAAHEEISFPKNELLLKNGETANEYYILTRGLVRSFVHDYDNNEITTEFFTENDIVIIASSFFQRIPSQENLQAVTECTLLKINYRDFQNLFHQIEGFSAWGSLWFSHQVFGMKQKSLDMIMKTASERYLKLVKEKPQIILNAPLKQVASYLGITDSSLSRIRKEISEK